MTEIKSAIDWFEELLTKEGLTESEVKHFRLAINSFNAWEEVLNQLQEWKNNAENDHEQKISYAYFSAIKIINQHLEIEEGEEDVCQIK